MNHFINRLKDELNDKKSYIKSATQEINNEIMKGEIDEKKLLKITQRIQSYTLEICELQTKIYILEEVNEKDMIK